MKHDSKLASMIDEGNFVVTAEFLPGASADRKAVEALTDSMKSSLTAINVSDNPFGPVMSSLSGSVIMDSAGIEPVYQIITRDRNRIAIQSDLLGASSLGIKNVLCLSGHHQKLTDCPESANVYDIDSIQLIASVKQMRDEGLLLNGNKIEGSLPILIGAVASPDMKPLELNILRLAKKVTAGAEFIQTQAIFDIESFENWLNEAKSKGITEKTAILAGVLPLESASEAIHLKEKYMDLTIPDSIIERLTAAGDEASQKKEGISICVETIKKIKDMDGVKGIHILSGAKENMVPEIITASGL